ncbi:MAG: hypothetical protein HGB26_08445 [Desulfobulbaceae bacterium]|nr:hypothetical protein [Desulfobulbaceae bacterium]
MLPALLDRSSFLRDTITSKELLRAIRLPVNYDVACKLLAKRTKGDDSWVLIHADSKLVSLRLCNTDDFIHVRAYSKSNGDVLYLIATQRGTHGQTWAYDAQLYRLGEKSFINIKLKQLGIAVPKENEFLPIGSQFRASENAATILSLESDGRLIAEPWTWMEPKWEHLRFAYEIYFEWNGNSFRKVKKNVL